MREARERSEQLSGIKSEINAEVLERELGLRGWSKGRLAEEAGVSLNTVSRIFKGGPVSATTWWKVKLALLLKPAELTELVEA